MHKRSSNRGNTHAAGGHTGVGARHKQSNRQRGGLGYLNIYTNSDFSVQKKGSCDPRIAHLKKMGLDWRWVRIAKHIGFDTFIQTWALISATFAEDRAYVRASIPHVSKLLRYQRDIFIRSMGESGMSVAEIRAAVLASYQVALTPRMIRYIICHE